MIYKFRDEPIRNTGRNVVNIFILLPIFIIVLALIIIFACNFFLVWIIKDTYYIYARFKINAKIYIVTISILEEHPVLQ